MAKDWQEGLSSTDLPSYPVLLTLSFAFIALAFWPSKRLWYEAATESTKAPVVGISSDTWFANLRGKYQYIRNGYWTIHEGYRKVCLRTIVYLQRHINLFS